MLDKSVTFVLLKEKALPFLNSFTATLIIAAAFFSTVSAQSSLVPHGSGTANDPYQISGLENLAWVLENSESWSAYFTQTADIDASPTVEWDSGRGWKPIGDRRTPFSGFYNGNGHIISGLSFDRDSSLELLGMFGFVSGPGCVIAWLGLTGIDFTMRSKSSGSYTNLSQTSIGGIAGRLSNHAEIHGCFTDGSLSAPIGRVSIGSIAGTVDSSFIATCYSNCTITAISPSNLGGLIGHWVESSLMNSYSSSRFVVDVINKDWFGGLVGLGVVEKNRVKNCFWDIETSGIDTSRGGAGTGKITVEMFKQSTYGSWDFIHTWEMNNGKYPMLRKPVIPEVKQPSGEGTESAPFRISSLENLLWLSGNPGYWDRYFLQTAPIDASGSSGWYHGYGWSPVGTNNRPFTGVYDGGGYTIDKLTINRPGLVSTGFFGTLNGKTGYLKNIVLTNATIHGFRNIGAIAGKADSTLISNCSSLSTTCTADNAWRSTAACIGGITGYSRVNKFRNCVYSGSISGDTAGTMLGGLIGTGRDDTVMDCRSTAVVKLTVFDACAGGLIGEMMFCKVFNCTTLCTINTSGNWGHAGGLIGETSHSFDIKNCMTSGTMTCHGTSTEAGGLIGYISGGGTIFKCRSACSITATGSFVTMGGLVSTNYQASISQCFSTGKLTGHADNNNIAGLVYSYNSSVRDTIMDCYSLSPVEVLLTGTKPNCVSNIHGLVGSDDECVKRCYSAGSITITGLPMKLTGESGRSCFWDSEAAGPGVYSQGGLSTVEMKTQSTYTDSGWDFTTVWILDPEVNDGYPSLRWQNPGLTKKKYQPHVSGTVPLIRKQSDAFVYTLFSDEDISIKMFNLRGVCVASLVEKHLPAGSYSLKEYMRGIGSGKYMMIFNTGRFKSIQNITIFH